MAQPSLHWATCPLLECRAGGTTDIVLSGREPAKSWNRRDRAVAPSHMDGGAGIRSSHTPVLAHEGERFHYWYQPCLIPSSRRLRVAYPALYRQSVPVSSASWCCLWCLPARSRRSGKKVELYGAHVTARGRSCHTTSDSLIVEEGEHWDLLYWPRVWRAGARALGSGVIGSDYRLSPPGMEGVVGKEGLTRVTCASGIHESVESFFRALEVIV